MRDTYYLKFRDEYKQVAVRAKKVDALNAVQNNAENLESSLRKLDLTLELFDCTIWSIRLKHSTRFKREHKCRDQSGAV